MTALRGKQAETADNPARHAANRLARVLLALLAATAIGATGIHRPAHSAGLISEAQSVDRVTIIVNKSRTFNLAKPFATVAVGSGEIAEAMPMSDKVLYVQGKRIGTTNISIFDNNAHLVSVIDVEVTPDYGNLQDKIRASTGIAGIRVSSSQGQVALTGVAPDAVSAERAMEVAKSLVPGTPVVNAMSVAATQQVMLKVRFLEVSRQAGREIGVNWFGANGNGTRGFNTGLGNSSSPTMGRTIAGTRDTSGNAVTGLRPSPTDTNNNFRPTAPTVVDGSAGIPILQTAGTLLATSSSPFGVVLANLVNKGSSIDVMISALETKNMLRRLAEPDLVALSGDTAAFLAGGEFPYPIPGGGLTLTPTIEFKPFGVQLTFTPTVLANGKINLRLAPSVSELDPVNSVTILGTTVPSIVKREARTTIELRDGQSFAIAGLLQTHSRRDIAQLPWIGSVPVLGTLFSSKSFQQDETDLVVIVTPHLVAPATPGQQIATPLDQHVPTNDVDFFLGGQMELRKKYQDFVSTGGGLQGPYGYIIPTEPGLPPVAVKN